MDMSMFTGFEGRINRAKWWLGVVIIVVLMIVLNLILGALLGASIFSGMGATASMAAETISSWTRKIAIAQLIGFVILIYPILSLAIKRLNDRERPNYVAYLMVTPWALSILAGLAGLTMSVTDTAGVAAPSQTPIGWILALLNLGALIWTVVELGILKGTTGPNANGPDPLGA